jgi:hypothetical protein
VSIGELFNDRRHLTLQGPNQSAQKSTMTGFSDFRTNLIERGIGLHRLLHPWILLSARQCAGPTDTSSSMPDELISQLAVPVSNGGLIRRHRRVVCVVQRRQISLGIQGSRAPRYRRPLTACR